jgi:hypothetical protein
MLSTFLHRFALVVYDFGSLRVQHEVVESGIDGAA